MQIRVARKQQKVAHNAGGIYLNRGQDGIVRTDENIERHGGQVRTVRVARIQAHDECGFRLAGDGLQKLSLAVVHLQGIRSRIHQFRYHAGHILEPGKKAAFIEHAVIDSDIEAVA